MIKTHAQYMCTQIIINKPLWLSMSFDMVIMGWTSLCKYNTSMQEKYDIITMLEKYCMNPTIN